MVDAREYKQVRQRFPEPYEYMSVDVCPVSGFGAEGSVGHSIAVMSQKTGQGHRYSLEYAEAHAKAVLRAIRAYRRKNAELMGGEGDA